MQELKQIKDHFSGFFKTIQPGNGSDLFYSS